MATIAEVQDVMQLLLVESATEHGLRSGWCRRRGQISASQFVQTLVFGFLEAPLATMGHLARVAGAQGAAVTPQALSQRFSTRSVALLRGVLEDALGVALTADPVAVRLLQAFPGGVYLNDSTVLSLHPDWRAAWPGSGAEDAAAVKIPTLLDLLGGTLQADLTPGRQHDSVTRLANLSFPPGALVIEDLGYLDIRRMQAREAQGVATVLPLRNVLALFDLDLDLDLDLDRVHDDDQGTGQGRPLTRSALLTWLQQEVHTATERWVGVHREPGHPRSHAPLYRVRLVAIPVSPATAARKREGIHQAARKHGREADPTTLALADWQILLTTIPPERATPEQIGTLMRMRWQIELLFKLWKDQGHLDETRGWNPARLETEWYAKLLGLLLQHWLLLTSGGWQWADRSLVKAGQAIREYARMLCLGWQQTHTLEWICTLMARAIQVTGHVASHSYHQSSAFYLTSA